MFVTLNGEDQFLLVGPAGNAIGPDAVRDFVAEPLTIHGELLQRGESRLLRIDVAALHHNLKSKQSCDQPNPRNRERAGGPYR